MEFLLNKIDPNLRRKINDQVDENKVHPKKDIQINKDKEQSSKEQHGKEYKEIKRPAAINKKIVISAEKSSDLSINGFINGKEDIIQKKGRFLDIKK